jgi:hypothetical protein
VLLNSNEKRNLVSLGSQFSPAMMTRPKEYRTIYSLLRNLAQDLELITAEFAAQGLFFSHPCSVRTFNGSISGSFARFERACARGRQPESWPSCAAPPGLSRL